MADLAVLLSIAGALAWTQIANYRTCAQRRRLGNAITAHALAANPDASEMQRRCDDLWAAYDAVSYERHMLALLLRRDPYSLYATRLADLVRGIAA